MVNRPETVRAPANDEALVVVESNDPTVSCDVVAMRADPSALEVMMEFGANDVEFVPPFAIGRVPVTPVVRDTVPASVESDRQVLEIE